jgi:HEAT repeat protein
MSDDQLAGQFAERAIKEFGAQRRNETRLMVRLAKERIVISTILKSRNPDGRKALLPLLNHENPQVRLNAAEALAGFDLERAVATLKDLHRSAPSFQRGAAGVDLYLIESGKATLG